MFSDWKYAARLLLKTPGFTATAILILAIAIAGNTATFSAVNVLLLEPLPFRDAGRLVVAFTRERATGARAGVSLPEYEDWTRADGAFDGTAAVELEQSFNVSGGTDPIRVSGGRMTASLLPLLGVSPVRGRALLPEDERPGAPPVVLITDRFWTTRFGRAERAIGSGITLDGFQATVVGVLPADFKLLYGGYGLWAPLGSDQAGPDRTRRSLFVIGRLPQDTTIDQSAAALAAVTARLEREHPETNAGWRGSMLPMRDFLLAGRGHTLMFVLTALGLLLLVACANVASLQLARAAARQRDIATRVALGASRWRVIRMLLAEAAIVAAVSGGCALAVVAGARRVLLASSPDLRELAISLPVLGFTLALMLVTTVAFGLVPALTAARVDLTSALKGTFTTRRSTRRLRSALVVAELASSLILLVPAGLLFKSFLALRQTEPGFRVDDVLTFSVALPASKYPDPQRQTALVDSVLSRMAALPAVQNAAAADALPLDTPAEEEIRLHNVRSRAATGGDEPDTIRAVVRGVSPGYLRTFEIRLLAGRQFTDQDSAGAPAVAIVNETLASAMRPDGQVLGELVDVSRGTRATIVGIAADLRSVGLRTPPQPEVLVPMSQRPRPALTFAIASSGDPLQHAAAAREIVRRLDPDLPLAYVRPMAEIVDEQVVAIRAIGIVLATLAALALVLAAAGLSGIMSWLVTQRTHEMGVRAALGATRRDLVMLVMRDALVLVAWGVGLGLPAALGLARMVSSQLWGVSAADLSIFAVVPSMLFLAAVGACYAPARRAARLEPSSALRAQ